MNGEDEEIHRIRSIGRRQRRIERPTKVGATAIHEQGGGQHQKGKG